MALRPRAEWLYTPFGLSGSDAEARMVSVGFALLCLSCCPSAPPGLAVAAPKLQRGDELVYSGEIHETSDRPDNRFKKKHLLEVRVFVLEADADSADCAVMTALTIQNDDKVASAVRIVSGSGPANNRDATTAQLQLIRVDSQGLTQILEPLGPPPLTFAKAKRSAVPASPLDSVSPHELGFFVPLPLEGAKVGGNWAVADPVRPPTVWNAKAESTWNGSRCIEVTALQKSTGWDQPNSTPVGWYRSESILASPETGFASVVQRDISRRLGRDIVARIGVKYELQQTNRYLGPRYTDMRKEIEQAWSFGSAGRSVRRTWTEDRLRSETIQRYLDDHPNGGTFRPVLESCRNAAAGASANVAPPVLTAVRIQPAEPAVLRIGYPAPDFVVADVDRPTGRFRLSANKSKPTVAIFFKPGSATSQDTLLFAEALHQHFGDKVSVVPLAIGSNAAAASKQREELKLKVPIYDGFDIRDEYRVTTFPQFFLLESTGNLKWTFDAGVGPETGFLVKRELEAILK